MVAEMTFRGLRNRGKLFLNRTWLFRWLGLGFVCHEDPDHSDKLERSLALFERYGIRVPRGGGFP